MGNLDLWGCVSAERVGGRQGFGAELLLPIIPPGCVALALVCPSLAGRIKPDFNDDPTTSLPSM